MINYIFVLYIKLNSSCNNYMHARGAKNTVSHQLMCCRQGQRTGKFTQMIELKHMDVQQRRRIGAIYIINDLWMEECFI